MNNARNFLILAQSVKKMKETHNIVKMCHKCDLKYSKMELEAIHYENYTKCLVKTIKLKILIY